MSGHWWLQLRVINISFYLDTLRLRWLDFAQLAHKVDISLKVRRVPLTGDWFIEDNVVSKEKVRDDRSLIYERKNRCPKTEPWGTPDLTGSPGDRWSWELERLAFLNICSLLAMSVLISLLIQGVADLIGTLLLGMEQFMASMKTVFITITTFNHELMLCSKVIFNLFSLDKSYNLTDYWIFDLKVLNLCSNLRTK